MIRIDLPWLVFACLLVFLAGIFLFWISWEILRRQRAASSIRHRLRCSVCCMDFSDPSRNLLATCPRCGSLNERSKPRVF